LAHIDGIAITSSVHTLIDGARIVVIALTHIKVWTFAHPIGAHVRTGTGFSIITGRAVWSVDPALARTTQALSIARALVAIVADLVFTIRIFAVDQTIVIVVQAIGAIGLR
jgi:hypothetical protein